MEFFVALACGLLIFIGGIYVGEAVQKVETRIDCERMGRSRLHNEAMIECKVIDTERGK